MKQMKLTGIELGLYNVTQADPEASRTHLAADLLPPITPGPADLATAASYRSPKVQVVPFEYHSQRGLGSLGLIAPRTRRYQVLH